MAGEREITGEKELAVEREIAREEGETEWGEREEEGKRAFFVHLFCF